jgi:hypothetical protein
MLYWNRIYSILSTLKMFLRDHFVLGVLTTSMVKSWLRPWAYSRCSPAGARAPRLRSVQLMIVDVGGTVDGFREPTGYCALP